jgi:hypothetical protein
VRGKHKGFYVLFLLTLLVLPIGTSCSSHVAQEADSGEETVQTADKADEDEVVETDDSSSSTASEEETESSQQKTTGVLMAIGYLAMQIGMTVLPLLMM